MEGEKFTPADFLKQLLEYHDRVKEIKQNLPEYKNAIEQIATTLLVIRSIGSEFLKVIDSELHEIDLTLKEIEEKSNKGK